MDAVTAEWIFPVTSPPLHRHAVELRGNKISALRPLKAGESFIPGSCLVPGFVNAHTHLAYTALRNSFDNLSFFPWIRKLTEIKYNKLTADDISASTRLGISECIRSGITTVADLSDLEISVKELSLSPLRGVFYWEIFGVEKDQAGQSWKDLQQSFPRLVDQYASARLQIGVSPHACYTVRPELYSLISDWAIRSNIPVSFHVSESKEEENFIANRSGAVHEFLKDRASDWPIHGNSSIEHLERTGIFETSPLIAHLVQASAGDLDLLSKYSLSIAHCPKSNAKFGHGIAPIVDLIQRGFPVGLGTDSACSNNRLDILEEARFSLLQQRSRYAAPVLNEEMILRMMTIEGAKSLKLSDQIGSIEKGKYADLVLFHLPTWYQTSEQVLRHLIHNSAPTDIHQTFIDGEPVAAWMPPGEELSRIYQKLV